MVAAVYARKFTEQRVDAELRWVEFQVERARVFAASRGWEVARTFVDDAVSGGIADRPAVLALRAAGAERRAGSTC